MFTLDQLEVNRQALVDVFGAIRDEEEFATGPILGKDWSLRLQVHRHDGAGRVYDLTIDPDGNIMIIRGPGDTALLATDGSIIQA